MNSTESEADVYQEFNAKRANGSCPVCGNQCQTDLDIRSYISLVVCPVCGKFRDTSVYVIRSGERNGSSAHKLSHFFRSISERALGKHDTSYFRAYEPGELEEVIDAPDPSVQEKLRLLLQYLARLSAYPGQQIPFDAAHDYSILCAKNEQEAVFHLDCLESQGLLILRKTLSSTICIVTASGWQSVEEGERTGGDSPYAFIAMWFDSSQDGAGNAIHAAVQDSGYIPIRIDEVEHVNRIDDEIIARLRQCKFMIADFTGQRNGVYFEAGFTLGLGRPVIWLCAESDKDNIHFDTRQYNAILYNDPRELQKKLEVRILALLGKGSNAHGKSE